MTDAKKKVIYLMGSLRNEKVPYMANKLRELGFEVFDDWFSPGPEADDFWRKYEKARGSTYKEALNNWAGKHVFEFDHYHLDRSDIGVLYMPAGKSCHLEIGYLIGKGKPAFILFDKEPERWDVMYQFVFLTGGNVCFSFDDLKSSLELLVIPKNNSNNSIDVSW
jgi:nucleoside 2-deoxyribosyltransferase